MVRVQNLTRADAQAAVAEAAAHLLQAVDGLPLVEAVDPRTVSDAAIAELVTADTTDAGLAEAVTRLETAGWANVGKANLHEFAYGITSQNPHYGDVPNPTAPGRVAGGSSGGSAAALATPLPRSGWVDDDALHWSYFSNLLGL